MPSLIALLLMYYQVPLVPYLPALSIFVNIAMMLQLNYLTWIRLVIWLAVGKFYLTWTRLVIWLAVGKLV